MSDYGGRPIQHPAFSTEGQRHSESQWTARRAAEATEGTKTLTEQLVQSSLEAQERELKMLFWARFAAVAGIVAVVATVVGVIVTVMAT